MSVALGRDLDVVRVGLERWLGRPVRDLTRAAAGYSCETLIADREVVIRLPPLGEGTFPDYDLGLQAAVQEAAAAAGVPVATPATYEPDPSFLGVPFLALPFVPGPIPGDLTPADPWLGQLPDEGRATVWRSFLDVVVDVHAVPTGGLVLRRGLDDELAFWEGYLPWACGGDVPPALTGALAWCRANRPGEEPPAGLLWGDVRFGNVVFDERTLRPRAVLDWDLATLGPLEMDLAWWLALEQVQQDLTGLAVPGFGSRDDAVARVAQRLGRPLVDLWWFEVFALVRASAVATRIAGLQERAGRRPMFPPGEDPTLAAALDRIRRAR